jgi:hypothetical protein
MALLTELEAVNRILASIGEDPLDAIAEDDVDAQVVLGQLRLTSKELQTKGWSFNREDSVTFTPSTDNEIVLPSNILKASPTDSSLKLVQRGQKMYNKTTHDFKVTGAVLLDTVILLDWEDLPASAQLYIVAKACFDYSLNQVGSDFQAGQLKELAAIALTNFNIAEDSSEDYSFFNAARSPSAFHLLNRGGSDMLSLYKTS